MHREYADENRSSEQQAEIACYLGGGVDFVSKTVINALYPKQGEYIEVASRILYEQFPTELGTSLQAESLKPKVEEAGFNYKSFINQYKNHKGLKKLKIGKVDHRHWMANELDVAPHTFKMGIAEGVKLPMGKCKLSIKERG